jgi:hypothetical protein
MRRTIKDAAPEIGGRVELPTPIVSFCNQRVIIRPVTDC